MLSRALARSSTHITSHFRRLESASKGEDAWLNNQFENDETMKKEIQDRKVVEQYCKIWCQVLSDRRKEVDEAQAIRRAQSN